jgi:hypothetical protein
MAETLPRCDGVQFVAWDRALFDEANRGWIGIVAASTRDSSPTMWPVLYAGSCQFSQEHAKPGDPDDRGSDDQVHTGPNQIHTPGSSKTTRWLARQVSWDQ